jgi:hypothetical protein
LIEQQQAIAQEKKILQQKVTNLQHDVEEKQKRWFSSKIADLA